MEKVYIVMSSLGDETYVEGVFSERKLAINKVHKSIGDIVVEHLMEITPNSYGSREISGMETLNKIFEGNLTFNPNIDGDYYAQIGDVEFWIEKHEIDTGVY